MGCPYVMGHNIVPYVNRISHNMCMGHPIRVWANIRTYAYGAEKLYITIVLYILFSLTFQKVVKLVELISNSNHTVAMQSS